MEPKEPPNNVTILEMLSKRSQEIHSLVQEIEKKMPKLATQRLPRIMRRRAASSNPKRIPKSCRSSWFKTQTQENVSASKNKKRRQLKKHISSKERQQAIQRRKHRLDRSLLHVWFAKRFKMERLDGHLVPIHNTNKNQRTLFRKSKNHCCYFYMSPYLRSFEVKGVKMESFLEKMSKFTYEKDILDDLCKKKVFKIHVHDLQNNMISPLEIFVINDNLQVWCPFSVAQEVQKFLDECFPHEHHSFEDVERIRLVGPESWNNTTKIMGVKSSDETQDLAVQENSVIVRDAIGDRITTDLIVPRTECRNLWNLLVKNRGHFVGGLRDLKMLHFNAGQPLFPIFGYSDHPLNKLSETNECMKICRESIRGLKDLDIKFLVEKLKTTNTSSFLNVIILSKGKGIPIKGSLIFKPTSTYISTDYEENVMISPSQKTSCGFVEFGDYCLEAGKGKGMGVVRISDLIEIIETNILHQQNQQVSPNNIFCLYKKPTSDKIRVGIIQFIK
jgi:hypothetical protein